MSWHRHRRWDGGASAVANERPGARYSVAFAVSVAIAKYADHLPLERQVKMARRRGLDIADAVWDQLDALAKVLAPGYAALGKYVLSQPVIGADETTWRLMGGKGKRRGGRFQLAHCWAHVRRKFVEAEAEHPQQCGEVLDLIGELYEVERQTVTGPPDERARLRAERSRDITKRIEKWALGAGRGRARSYCPVDVGADTVPTAVEHPRAGPCTSGNG